MKTITTNFEELKPNYNLESLADLKDIIFLDIETTGLTPKNSNLYLIGCVYYENESYHSIQWFAEKYEEELQVLTSFFEFLKKYKYLIHYNGNNFDIPYLLKKCEEYNLDYNFDNCGGIDIYRRITLCRDLFPLADLKQKTVEDFLGLDREDTYSGRELISKYHNYVCNPTENELNELLLHNEEDLKGMLSVVSMLSYSDIFNKPIRVMKAQANYYNGDDRRGSEEIVMKLRFESPLPMPVSFKSLGCKFTAEGLDGSLSVPMYDEEMKYFYSNYKNYYYLPAEDIAMHKSVASYVDKSHRIQANASNCYTRKKSKFLPQFDLVFTPFFKREYKSKAMFFELTDDFKKSRSAFSMYASHILDSMLKNGIE